ncbi:MAG: hypothetical protein HY892_15045 [Deltaproteobacteria bacterium]|nr:hypothetical protein [Deltaproteobacteria bacterium]
MLALILIGVQVLNPTGSHRERLLRLSRLVEDLALTDLCLFTEARYTRHLSQADRYSPFQDHPAALEHFPSGSLVGPPQRLGKPNAVLD